MQDGQAEDEQAEKVKSIGRLNVISVRFGILYVILGSIVSVITYAALLVFPAPGGAIISTPAILVAGLSVAVSGAAAYLLANLLGARIRMLTHAASSIAEGNLDADITFKCSCEVGHLADGMRAMQSTLRAKFDEINDLALFDRSTSLPNRHFLMRCLGIRMAQEKSGQTASGALIYVNLNGFKKVNDTHGHAAGDMLLHACAERILTQALNSTVDSNRTYAKDDVRACLVPLLARFGGDEFAIHIPDSVMVRDLGHVADRVSYLLTQPFQINERMIQISSAIGVARYPVDGSTPDDIVRNAGLAMRSAKDSSSRSVRIFGEAMLQDAVALRELEADMRRALDLEQFEVYYQPKFAASSEELIGVEALVRWNHPTRGLLAPGAFIEMAEMTGLISDLGQVVTRAAIRQCAIFAKDRTPINVAINVSLAQLERGDFADYVLELIRQYNAPPQMLTFEITESLASVNLNIIKRQMSKLRFSGVKFAIDDFGTGYSNFSQMLTLRFDELKIDRSLVSNVCTDAQHAAAVRMIVALGKSIGCRVLAEGVETREQLTRIKALGCDEIQGFLFAKPMQIDELRKWTKDRSANIEAVDAPPAISLRVASL